MPHYAWSSRDSIQVIVIDVLGGYSKGLTDNMRSVVVEERGKQMLRRMQKAVLHVTSSLNNARSFKILC